MEVKTSPTLAMRASSVISELDSLEWLPVYGANCKDDTLFSTSDSKRCQDENASEMLPETTDTHQKQHTIAFPEHKTSNESIEAMNADVSFTATGYCVIKHPE